MNEVNEENKKMKRSKKRYSMVRERDSNFGRE
jgi:hypothetical protein